MYGEMSGTCIGLSTLPPWVLPHLQAGPMLSSFFPEGLRNPSQFSYFSSFPHHSTFRERRKPGRQAQRCLFKKGTAES